MSQPVSHEPSSGSGMSGPPWVTSHRAYARETIQGTLAIPVLETGPWARRRPSAVKSVIWVSSVIAPVRPYTARRW